MSNWKIISEKQALKSNLFEVRNTIISDGKNRESHFNVYQPPAVLILPLTNINTLLLISEYRYLIGKDMLGCVAGFIDEGETPLAAARRELQEEIGYTAHQLEEIARVEKSMSVIKGTMHIFLAKELEKGQSNPEITEEIRIVETSLSNAVEKVMSGEIVDVFAGFGILLLDKLRIQNKL